MLGRFMAFDRHMNLVLGDSEEFRKLPPKKGRSEDEVRSQHPCPLALLLQQSSMSGAASRLQGTLRGRESIVHA